MFREMLKDSFNRLKSFGGWRLVRTYWRMGVLWTAIREATLFLIGKKGFGNAYSAISNKVGCLLQAQYAPLLINLKEKYQSQHLEQHQGDKIWFCWLQGIESAPELVRACHHSLVTHIPEREVVVLSLNNYDQYCSLPPDIVEKYRQGKIPNALFSDMLRLQLLCQNGGTWIDATILCTGHNFPDKILSCPLFLFQALRKGDRTIYGISNWFITAHSNNPLLLVMRDMLFQYWRDYDCTVDYYIFHFYFMWLAQYFPDEISAMPRGNRLLPIQLVEHLGEEFSPEWMTQLTSHCCFHKLDHRKGCKQQEAGKTGTYYHYIIDKYLPKS